MNPSNSHEPVATPTTDPTVTLIEREVLPDLTSIGRAAMAICLIALCGATMLAPLALILYLISWIGCR